MSPNTITTTPPKGYRFMLAHEAERLDYASPIRLWNGEISHGTVRSHTDEAMTVVLRSGAIITLDLDHPDYWADGEHRDRRPPMSPDGEFVAIQDTMATPDEEIEPLLRTSVALALAAKDDVELQSAVANLRRIITDRLRGRAA